MKKKIRNLLKLFSRNRHCIVAMFVLLVLVFVSTFDTFAQNTAYWGNMPVAGGTASYESGGTVVDVYDLTETNGYYPTLSSSEMQSYYGGSGTLGGGGNKAQGFPSSASNFGENWIFVDSNNNDYCLFVPTNMTQSSGGTSFPLALNAGYYLGTFDTNTYREFMNFRFSSAGNLALVSFGNYYEVVSDQPLYWGRVACNAGYGAPANVYFGCVDEAGEDGLYHYGFENYTFFVFSNMPIYRSSSDGSTGFTGSNDFSFSNENTNFNNLIRSGVVIDPAAGGDDSSVIDPDGTHYNYASADPQFTAFNNNGISCKWSFVLNDYMKVHPDDFQFHAIYNFNFKLASGATYKFTARHEPLVSDILLNGDALYNTSDLYHSFVGDGNLSMATWLQTIFNQSSNTSGYYSDGSVISYGVNQPGNTRSFSKFTLGLQHIFDNVVISASFDFVGYFEFLGDPREESGKISGNYDLRNGETKITQNDITKNLNPPSEYDPQYPQTLNPNTSGVQGAVNSAVATIASGAIQISTGNKGFQMSQADWNHFGDLIEEMRTDLTTLENNNTSFPMVIKNTFDCLPSKIWTLIFLGITGSVTIALWNKAAHNH